MATDRCPTIVLDDDPTGTQGSRGVSVLLSWSPDRIAQTLAASPGNAPLYLMTNTRALSGPDARRRTLQVARAALEASPAARIVLRGDSTLRGHVREEYEAVLDARGIDRAVLLLVPALPSAGRVTVDGRQLLVSGERSVPLDETEYARDHGFAYTSSRLLAWAEERSGGLLDRRRGRELPLARLRARGAAAVAEALEDAWRTGGHSACAPDAADDADLLAIADGLRQAEAAGVPVVVRAGPTFPAVLTGTLAAEWVELPDPQRGALVVCGSYVGTTSAQLDHLARRGVEPLFLSPTDLAGPDPQRYVTAAAEAARRRIRQQGVAVVATERSRPAPGQTLATGLRIAHALAEIVPAVGDAADVIVAKGGITSAVTLEHGLGTDEARVIGPVRPGVALWHAASPTGPRPYLVVPGNVGGPSLLTDLIVPMFTKESRSCSSPSPTC